MRWSISFSVLVVVASSVPAVLEKVALRLMPAVAFFCFVRLTSEPMIPAASRYASESMYARYPRWPAVPAPAN